VVAAAVWFALVVQRIAIRYVTVVDVFLIVMVKSAVIRVREEDVSPGLQRLLQKHPIISPTKHTSCLFFPKKVKVNEGQWNKH
jgi:hypothetical protein